MPILYTIATLYALFIVAILVVYPFSKDAKVHRKYLKNESFGVIFSLLSDFKLSEHRLKSLRQMSFFDRIVWSTFHANTDPCNFHEYPYSELFLSYAFYVFIVSWSIIYIPFIKIGHKKVVHEGQVNTLNKIYK